MIRQTGEPDAGDGASGDLEPAEQRLREIYSELREIVQPSGTPDSALLQHRGELESEADDIRSRWDLSDPRGNGPRPSPRAGLRVLALTGLTLLAILGASFFLSR